MEIILDRAVTLIDDGLPGNTTTSIACGEAEAKSYYSPCSCNDCMWDMCL
jgi:hypothetical protein